MKTSLLSIYAEILFIKGIKTYKNQFISNDVLRKFGYDYIEDYDYFLKDEMIEDNDTNPVFAIDIIEKSNFFEKLLQLANTSSYTELESTILTLKDNTEKVQLLNTILNDLVTYLKKVNESVDEESLVIENKLKDVITYLKDRYQNLINYHTAYKFLIDESDLSYFKNKNLKYNFYMSLYQSTIDMYLIDDVETEEQTFIDVLTCVNPQIIKNKIRFITKNNITAYFLQSLKPFFDNFTYKSIEKSGLFVNKQGKPLKETDINTALSRGKNKDLDDKSKIDKEIQKLKEQYLN